MASSPKNPSRSGPLLASDLWKDLQCQLDEREGASLRRRLAQVPAGHLDLSGNDYMGLSQHPEVIAAACASVSAHGAGARASRLVSGPAQLYEELETELAQWKGSEAALVFASGYAANLGVVGALAGRGSQIFCHKRNHASLIDAVRLAETNGASLRFYESQEKLLRLLQGPRQGRRLIVTDGVFSMDGDLAELPELLRLAELFDALVLLDDAHGTGTLGITGRGLAEHFEVSSDRLIQVGTLSKALGSQGGFVTGPQVLVDWLVNTSRNFIYSTGLCPAAAGAALAALGVVQREPERVGRLHANGQRLQRQLRELGFAVPDRQAPILPLVIGAAADAVALSQRLAQTGIWCPAIRPPTVPEGTARLRITVSSEWGEEQFGKLADGFPGAFPRSPECAAQSPDGQ